ncbi:MAG: helix-turn-helix transcriptional regulator [Bacteroidetes bacterium]|nr:helix-turn-helix transcriptional regulator [Bacteroidota bacterium]
MENNHRERIGKKIAELRKERGISQNKLAQLTGISSSNIGKIELAQFNVGLETLCKIGDALGFIIDFIPTPQK